MHGFFQPRLARWQRLLEAGSALLRLRKGYGTWSVGENLLWASLDDRRRPARRSSSG